MKIVLVRYSEMTQLQQSAFHNYCRSQVLLDDPAAKNMWGPGTHTLTYILTSTDRFKKDNGEFYIVFADDEIAACSGVYKSEFSRYVALAGTRTWTTKEFRNYNLSRNYLLPEQKTWAINHGCRQVAICFNEYNKRLMKAPFRSRLGEGPIIRTPKHLFHSNINEVPFAVNIQDTPQWVLYESLDTTWNFDWSTIKCF